jgi:hypothetical protein
MIDAGERKGNAMFVQVIEGKVADAAQLRRQLDRWVAELAPGAAGWLGTTAGVSADGRGLAFARFESAAAARANSERPEQGGWWSETQGCFDGDVTFSDSEDVDQFLAGGSDDAGFVQVMKGQADRDALARIDERFAAVAATYRPDVLGGLRVWLPSDRYVEVVYFTSEADAREAEGKDPPPEMAADMEEFGAAMAGVEFIDLTDPWMF